MSDYWLISAPYERDADETWKKLSVAVSKVKSCSVYKFYIPVLKVGTMDTLLSDADNLVKLEMYLEGLISRLASGLETILVLENHAEVHDLLLVEGETVHNYLVTFNWDTAKYPTRQTIKCISDLVQKQATSVDNELKTKLQEYQTTKSAYEGTVTHDEGTLLTKNLIDIVKDEDIITSSHFITTVLVVVPKKLLNDWHQMYERFDDTVIPRSSRIIAQDSEYYLVGVALFKDRIPMFSETARKFKFSVRDHIRDNEEKMQLHAKMLQLKKRKEDLFGPLVKLVKHNFSEMFKAQVHLKACKLFVESVLRYGLPVNFRAAIIIADSKHIKKMREVLYNLYKHLDAITISDGDKPVQLDAASAVIGQNPSDYYPYVTCRINTEF